MTLPKYLKPQEVADWLGISRMALYLMVSRGQIPAERINRRCLRFCEDDLIAWREQHRVSSSKDRG
jgi:excisionase family DNA binding protein